MSVNKLKQKDWTKDGRNWFFQTRYTDLCGNVKKYKSKKFLNKSKTQEAERLFFLELDKYRPDNDMTFKELYLAFYEYQKDKVKETTIHTYLDRMRYMQLLDNIKVKDFDLQHYEMWRKKILEYKLSNRTRNYIYKFLKTIMNFGTKWYGLNFNNNTLTVRKGLSDNVNGIRYIISSPKTLNSNRTLPLSKELANDLRKLKQSVMDYTNLKKNGLYLEMNHL